MASFLEKMTGIKRCPGCQREISLEKEYCDNCAGIAPVNKNIKSAETRQEVRPMRDMGYGRETKMRYCSNCGSPIIHGTTFCSRCGNKLQFNKFEAIPQNHINNEKIGDEKNDEYSRENHNENWPALSPKWYTAVLKKYAVFEGRARRKEYWAFLTFDIIIVIILNIIEAGISGNEIGGEMSILASLYSLAVLIPNIAVAVRRLHDVNKSGWWLFVPLIGIILLLRNSYPGMNRYGYNPKE